MLAVDTNVVVRLLTGDDPAQTARAISLFNRERIFLTKTVIIETEWVLRSLYRFAPELVLDGLAHLIALSNTRTEDVAAVVDAITWSRQGLDFADALHIASSRDTEGFATFDADLIKRALQTTGMRAIRP
jgi:predicted nucleic-acid-binding protein